MLLVNLASGRVKKRTHQRYYCLANMPVAKGFFLLILFCFSPMSFAVTPAPKSCPKLSDLPINEVGITYPVDKDTKYGFVRLGSNDSWYGGVIYLKDLKHVKQAAQQAMQASDPTSDIRKFINHQDGTYFYYCQYGAETVGQQHSYSNVPADVVYIALVSKQSSSPLARALIR